MKESVKEKPVLQPTVEAYSSSMRFCLSRPHHIEFFREVNGETSPVSTLFSRSSGIGTGFISRQQVMTLRIFNNEVLTLFLEHFSFASTQVGSKNLDSWRDKRQLRWRGSIAALECLLNEFTLPSESRLGLLLL
jgi:hypothetical protein